MYFRINNTFKYPSAICLPCWFTMIEWCLPRQIRNLLTLRSSNTFWKVSEYHSNELVWEKWVAILRKPLDAYSLLRSSAFRMRIQAKWFVKTIFELILYILLFACVTAMSFLTYSFFRYTCFTNHIYHQISNVRRTKPQYLNICSCLYLIQWSHVLSQEWRCNCSSADRRCSNYIWVINNFIGY